MHEFFLKKRYRRKPKSHRDLGFHLYLQIYNDFVNAPFNPIEKPLDFPKHVAGTKSIDWGARRNRLANAILSVSLEEVRETGCGMSPKEYQY